MVGRAWAGTGFRVSGLQALELASQIVTRFPLVAQLHVRSLIVPWAQPHDQLH